MSYSQKYYFTFYSDRDTRIINGTPDEYSCDISQLDYAGSATEIQAQQNPIQINYQNTSSNKLEAIIGSEATLNLIATEDFELEDLYTENEREFLVEIFRNGTLIWSGFIIPDGCQESFTFAPYVISVNAVDGLGLLKNLSYVQNDGNFYLGKQSFIEVMNNHRFYFFSFHFLKLKVVLEHQGISMFHLISLGNYHWYYREARKVLKKRMLSE
jgi:hypothetical protein